MDVPFAAMLDAHLSDARLKEALSVLTGYLSEDPGALTVGAMAPIFGYHFDGGYYPAGGSQQLADALVSAIRDRGGEVRLRTAVSRIRVEGGRAAGVVLATGEEHRAAAVVSNADLSRTFGELLGPEHLSPDFVRRLATLRPSASAFAVFLGVDYVPEVEPLTLLAGPGRRLGIAVPSGVDPSLAPPGHSAVTLLTLVPPGRAAEWDRRAPGYAARKRAMGDRLIAAAEEAMSGLAGHIVYRQEGSPATFARYAWATAGAIYGPAAGQWRPPARSPLPGLVLAGAGVFPGAGVEAAVISGTLAADALCPPGLSRLPVQSRQRAA
jgi:phytoene dehydrogenase-like protein